MKLMKITSRSPLLSWDLYVGSYKNLLVDSRKKVILEELKDFKRKYNWGIDLLGLIDTIDFDAVVVTNSKQQIEYASEGFRKLTGYPFKFTKGKSPQFLQGENTCFETRKRIRKYIKKEKSFNEEVINYKKNGDEYRCWIAVFPVRSYNTNKITHFIALEREIKSA